jgi:hypothetical protein
VQILDGPVTIALNCRKGREIDMSDTVRTLTYREVAGRPFSKLFNQLHRVALPMAMPAADDPTGTHGSLPQLTKASVISAFALFSRRTQGVKLFASFEWTGA